MNPASNTACIPVVANSPLASLGLMLLKILFIISLSTNFSLAAEIVETVTSSTTFTTRTPAASTYTGTYTLVFAPGSSGTVIYSGAEQGAAIYSSAFDITGIFTATSSADWTVVFEKNKSGHAAALAARTGSVINVDGAIFRDNVASGKYAGAIYLISGSSTLNARSTLFTSNSSVGASTPVGGAMYLAAYSVAHLESSTFSNNYSGAHAGAIYTATNVIINADNAHFKANKTSASAGLGGVIYTGANTLFNTGTAKIEQNTATRGGAFWFGATNTLNASHAVFTSNTATVDNGGAIYTGANNIITVDSGIFKYNKANTNGGAIFLTSGSLLSTAATYESNVAGNNGGAINASSAGYIIADYAVFKSNTAASGGAIYGISTFNATAALFKDNTATSNGGAIGLTGASLITLSSGTFTDNRAAGNGGAIYGSGTFIDATGVVFSNNVANTYGGAIYANHLNGGSLVLTDASFLFNTSGSGGGAVYLRNFSTANPVSYLKIGATATGTSTYSGNTNTGVANSITFAGSGTSVESSHMVTIDVASGGLLDMQDPMSTNTREGLAPEYTFTPTQITGSMTGGGLWKLGGENVWSGSGANTLNIKNGTLALYSNASYAFDNGVADSGDIFTLAGSGAVLETLSVNTFGATESGTATIKADRITLGAGSELRLGNNLTLDAGIVDASGITITAQSGSHTLRAGSGGITFSGANTVNIDPTAETLTIAAHVSVASGGAATLNLARGTLLISAPANVGDGGALSLDNATLQLTGQNIIFQGNNAAGGGAILAANGASFDATGASFINNTASGAGGAILARAAIADVTLKLGAAASSTSTFKGNTASGAANSITFSGSNNREINLNVDVQTGGLLDMQDPMSTDAAAAIKITGTKTGLGTWQLGGTNTLAATGGNLLHIAQGTFALRPNATLTLNNSGANPSAFTLAANATLSAGIGSSITAGSINLANASILSFDMGGAISLGAAGATTNLTLTTPSATDFTSAWNQTIKLLGTTSLVNSSTYSLLTLAGGAVFAPSDLTQFDRSFLTDDYTLLFSSDLKSLLVAYEVTYFRDRGVITWTNVSGDFIWNTTSTNWNTSGAGNADHKKFLSDDAVIFSGVSGSITVAPTGVQIAPQTGAGGPNPGMVVEGAGNLTFDGGAISGSGGLRMDGTGTLTLSNTNAFTGGSAINNGAVVAQNVSALGTGTINNIARLAFDLDDTNSGTFASSVIGTGTTTKQGAGTLTLANTATIANALTISAGTLANDGGNITGATTIATGAVLRYNSGSLAAIANNGLLDFANTAALTRAQAITGSGTLTKTGAGNLTLTNALSNALTVQTGTLITDAATAVIAGPTTIATGAALLFNSGSLSTIANTGRLDFANATAYTQAQTVTGNGTIAKIGAGNLTITNAVGNALLVQTGTLITNNAAAVLSGQTTIAASAALLFNSGSLGAVSNDGTVTFANTSAYTQNAAFSGSGAVIKTGAGLLTFAESSNFSGKIELTSGRIDIGASNALGTGTINAAANTTIGFAGDYTIANTINLLGSGTIDTSSYNVALDGSLNGVTAALAKTGTGRLTLNHSTTLASVNVAQGTLSIASGQTLTTVGSLNIANNAILSIASSGTSVIADTLSFNTGGILNIAGIGGDGGSAEYPIIPSSQQTVIVTNNGITGFSLDRVTIAGGGSSSDFLNVTPNLVGKNIIVETVLSWELQNAIAHGTFTLGAGQSFTINSVLNNNSSGPFTSGWDGKSLLKRGAGTLILTANNIYSGSTTLREGTLINRGVLMGPVIIEATSTLFQNSGTLRGTVSNSGNFKNDAGALVSAFTQSSGATSNEGVVNSTATINGGVFHNHASGQLFSPLNITGGQFINKGGSVQGTVTIGLGGTFIYENGSINTPVQNSGTLVFANTGAYTHSTVIEGTGVFVKSGANLTLGTAQAYTGETIITSGVLIAGIADAIKESSRITVKNAATFNMGGRPQTLKALALENGALVNFGGDGPIYTVLTLGELSGSGTFVMRANLTKNKLGNDRIVLAGLNSGTHALKLDLQVVGTPSEAPIQLVHNTGGSNGAVFTGSATHKLTTYSLVQGDGGGDPYSWYLKTDGAMSPAGQTILMTAANAGLEWHYALDSIYQRMGDLRGSKEAFSRSTKGEVWMRADAYHLSAGSEIIGSAFREDVYGVTAGTDKVMVNGKSLILLGVMLSASRTSRDFYNRGDSETDELGFGIYGSWVHSNGWYLDAVMKGSYCDNTLHARSSTTSVSSADYDTNIKGLSIELGHRYVEPDKWWFEPSLQVGIAMLGAESYTTDTGIPVEINSGYSLQTRIQVRVGRETKGRFAPYAKIAAVNTKMFDGKIYAENRWQAPNVDGWRAELGAGASYSIGNKGSQLYFEGAYTKAEYFERPWAISLGYRQAW